MNVDSSENLLKKVHSPVTPRLCFYSLVATVGMLQFGWNTGVINNPQTAIKLFINETLIKRGYSASESKTQLLIAVIVAIFAAGGLVGALLAGIIADKLGRCGGMMVANLVMIVSGLLMLISPYAGSYEMIIIGRLLSGLASGIFTGIVPIYLNEISPSSLKGAFGVLTQIGVVTGLFLSEIMSLTFVMGNKQYWNTLLGLIILPSILQGVCLIFCPKSPRYLLFFQNNEKAAEEALKKLRHRTVEIQIEMNQMKLECEHIKTVKQVGLLGILRSKPLLMSLVVGMVLHLSQQLSGINNIFYYSSTLFESVGVNKKNSEYSTLGVGGLMILMTLISVTLIDRYGRRILHIGGLFGCLFTSVCFTIFYSFQFRIPNFNYLSIVSALLFVASFGIGPGSIPWMMIPEMFPEDSRSAATSVGVSVNWLSNLIVGLIFPSLHDALKSLVFIPFIACQILSIIFLIFKMPETKPSSSETKTSFENRSCGKNKTKL